MLKYVSSPEDIQSSVKARMVISVGPTVKVDIWRKYFCHLRKTSPEHYWLQYTMRNRYLGCFHPLFCWLRLLWFHGNTWVPCLTLQDIFPSPFPCWKNNSDFLCNNPNLLKRRRANGFSMRCDFRCLRSLDGDGWFPSSPTCGLGFPTGPQQAYLGSVSAAVVDVQLIGSVWRVEHLQGSIYAYSIRAHYVYNESYIDTVWNVCR